jgi:hypothetical protein
MEFLSKVLFFALFGISILLTTYLVTMFFSVLLDPYKKSSEAIIIILGACFLGIGLYFAFQHGYLTANYLRGCFFLISAFVAALIVLVVGYLFFNGPIHWQ